MDDEILNGLYSGDLELYLEPQVLECARMGTAEEMETILGLGGGIFTQRMPLGEMCFIMQLKAQTEV